MGQVISLDSLLSPLIASSDGILHHLGILLVQVVSPRLAGVLPQVDLADQLDVGCPSEWLTVVVPICTLYA